MFLNLRRKNSLDHTKVLWKKLGSPGKDKKIIHVAGTNGKGSVCAFLASVLKEAGKKTGLFTSPHLITMEERFFVDGKMAAQDQFLDAFLRIMDVVEKGEKEKINHPTFFEWLFLMAMVLFEEEETDYIILETGLGGRLDATNIIEKPLITIITGIGFDHTEYLGETKEEIAFEKAGILKQGAPIVYRKTSPSVDKVIEERADLLQCPAIPVDLSEIKILGIKNKHIDFSFKSRYDKYINVKIQAQALYQTENAMVAIRGLEEILPEKKLYPAVLPRGMEKMTIQGRMEEMREGVYVDGAHNIDGIVAFCKTVKSLISNKERKKILLLFSAVQEKMYVNMIEELTKIPFSIIVVTTINNQRGVKAKEIASIFKKFTDRTVIVEDRIEDAYEKAMEWKGRDGFLFVTGSLYLVGELKNFLWRIERRGYEND